MVIAAKDKYGLQDPSGVLNSIRFAFGEQMGIRIDAERLRAEYAMLIGASNPGTSLLYELTVGFVNASNDFECLINPPIK